MKLFKIIVAIVFITLLSCESKNDKEYIHEPTPDSLVFRQIDSIGQSYLSQGGVMGLAIAVAKEGKLVYGRGFGYIDSTKTKPATDESYFLMASISKLMCATN